MTQPPVWSKMVKLYQSAQEERFNRIKHYEQFPKHSIISCVKEAKLSFLDIDQVVFYEKPFLKFERLLETYLSFAPIGFKSFKTSMPLWIKDKLFQKTLLIKELNKLSTKLIGKTKYYFLNII